MQLIVECVMQILRKHVTFASNCSFWYWVLLFIVYCFRAVVKKQQQKQYELEKAEEALSAKVAQRDAVLKEIQAESVNILDN